MGASLRGSMSSARDAVTGELEASRKSKGAADAAGELLVDISPISPLHLRYISPISPPYLPHISPIKLGELLGELVLEMDQIPPNADLTGWLPLLRRSGEPGGELQVRLHRLTAAPVLGLGLGLGLG